MRAIGLDVQRQEAAPGRPNVIGVLEGSEPGRSVMFCGHLDTVGVTGMDAPFDPVIRDGRLYGRGAQDMKGGVAAMIDAARVARAGGFRKGRIVIAAVVDEEYASLGADALVREWKADAAVVTEPTDLQIGIGHKGFAWAAVETRGRAAHGSRPAEGRDAILRMGRVLARARTLDRELQSRPPHPLLGTGSLHASIIEGRTRVEQLSGSVPAATRTPHSPRRERRDVRARDGSPARGVVRRRSRARRVDEAHVLPSALRIAGDRRTAARAAGCGGIRRRDGADRRDELLDRCREFLAEAGIPSVLFGPGGAGLHSREEYVTIDDVVTCRDALASLALNWL